MTETSEMKTTTNGVLDFQDPGMLPTELMDMPGFVNELKNHTLAVAARPNEPLAFAAALAMLAHLGGRTYRDSRGARTNLYVAALAPSGMGKEEPREVNKRLAAEVGLLGTLPDSVASGPALEEAVLEHPTLLMQCDEADTLLTSLYTTEGRSTRLSEMLLRLFGESRGYHAVRQLAKSGKVQNILNPHLTLFATGIPKFFYAALNAKALENGLLGRCLFLDTESFQPLGEMTPQELPRNVVETAQRLAGYEKAIEETGVITPIVVPDEPEATTEIAALKERSDTTTRGLMERGLGTAAALHVRVPEKVLKIALIRALSRNALAPSISGEDIRWATRLVDHLTRRMLYLAQFYVAEGKFDRLKKRFVGMLEKNGGSMDRSKLLRNLSIDAQTFQKIVNTLHLSNLIEEEMLARRQIVYTLTAA